MENFNIEYGKGFISVNVHNYFAKDDLPSIKKLFKIAKDFCTEIQKSELIQALKNSKEFWTKKYKTLNRRAIGLSYHKSVSDNLTPTTEKQLAKLHTKIDRIIEILQMENWKDETSLD